MHRFGCENEPMGNNERRIAARVVLVDDDNAVLLVSARDPGIAGASEFWFTPGGGAEPGETLEGAARREVHEEVGHILDGLGPVVWTRTTAFNFDGTSYVQEESFFVVRTVRFDARRIAWTDMESRSTTGWRWWPITELSSSDVVVYPPGLGVLVAEWLRDGPPDTPRRID
jgi:8-oxo-dGTP pyrophosphatase MutT (NUDIX family)